MFTKTDVELAGKLGRPSGPPPASDASSQGCSSQAMALYPAWPETNLRGGLAGNAARPAKRNDRPAWAGTSVDFLEEIPGTGEDGHTVRPVEPPWEELHRTPEFFADGRENVDSIDGAPALSGQSKRHRVRAGPPNWKTGCYEAIAVAVQSRRNRLTFCYQDAVSTPLHH